MLSSSIDRPLTVTGIVNLRDYGGYAVGGGRRLRSGLLFRSGDHGAATPEDLDRLADLDLTAIIDLRSASERSTSPSRRPPGFKGRVVWAPSYQTARAPHVAAMAEGPTAESVKARLRRAYGRIPFQAPMIEAFSLYFRTLAVSEGATLVHCAAGKDRTGIAVALLHASLGVHRDDIMADFLLTNTVGDPDARLRSGERRLRAIYGDTISIDVVRAALSVDAPCLNAMFDAVDEVGGIDGYLAGTLGLPGLERDHLAAGLTE